MSTLVRRLRRNGPNGIIGVTVMALLLFVGIFGPWLTPHNPLGLDLSARLAGPSANISWATTNSAATFSPA